MDRLSYYVGLTTVSILIFGLIVLTLGCAGPPPEPPPFESIHNEKLDLEISQIEEDWAVETNDGALLQFVRAEPARQGRVVFQVGPEELGVNLITALSTHRAGIERRPGGVYSGAQELSGPLGTAFYSRGRFTGEEGMLEETCILSLHPRASRLLTLTYTYPAADDSAKRVEELIGLFGAVE
ncbi:MAG: hypothetical protein K8R59_15045 [Thermoanaerobaculales bacterium]|nr:hypothetical protein [Thermoanaerobaculales bacterium]